MITSKKLRFFKDKAFIDKRNNKRTAYKIQFYNNRVIDQYITDFYNEDNLEIKPSTAMLWAELSVLNKPEVYKNYQRIINSKYTNNDAFFKMLIKNKANKDLNRIVEAEVERISKNLDYVEKVMHKYEIPYQKYQETLQEQKNNSMANRQKIIEDVARQANDLRASEGLNVPGYSYRDPEIAAESLQRQSQMQSEHELINSINEKDVDDGKSERYTVKSWIHTHDGKTTRHMSNHMQKMNINEPFIVLNDVTLDIDEMMYPSDPAGSPSNAYICYCEVWYD